MTLRTKYQICAIDKCICHSRNPIKHHIEPSSFENTAYRTEFSTKLLSFCGFQLRKMGVFIQS